MKTLVLCRHAKSSWKYHTDDIYRPLNKRGIAEAPMMAQQWRGDQPDLILCSPAVRAYATALAYTREKAWALDRLRLVPELFEADCDQLLDVLRGVEDSHGEVWLFGHNPGLNELAGYLTRQDWDNIVTGARVHLRLDITAWQSIGQHAAQVLQVCTPAMEDDVDNDG